MKHQGLFLAGAVFPGDVDAHASLLLSGALYVRIYMPSSSVFPSTTILSTRTKKVFF